MVSSPLPTTRELAVEMVRRLQSAGFRAFWVGGCVRDSLLGREPDDYDIATDARPEEIERLFPHTIPVGRQFGVVIVVEHTRQFQIATFRAEADYADGRRPSRVTFGDPQADASRRDFTVNGLFHDPVSGTTLDWVGGGADLNARCIRTIGEPAARFAEDHLRLLRAVRFAAQLDFQIEPATLTAIIELAERIKRISVERIRDELLKLFRPGRAERGLRLLRESGLLPHVLPEVAATENCAQSPDYHPEGTVFEHLCLMLRHLPADADPLLPWAVLMHDIAKPLTASQDSVTGAIHFYEHERLGANLCEAILGRLRFPSKQIETVATVVRHHMQFKDAPQMRQSTRRRMMLRPTFPLELALHRLDCLGSHGRLDIYDFLREQADELSRQPQLVPPLLTGNDLLRLGFESGPTLGQLLAELREKQLADELRTPAEAEAWARQKLSPR
jgi:poly(A) polymerase